MRIEVTLKRRARAGGSVLAARLREFFAAVFGGRTSSCRSPAAATRGRPPLRLPRAAAPPHRGAREGPHAAQRLRAHRTRVLFDAAMLAGTAVTQAWSRHARRARSSRSRCAAGRCCDDARHLEAGSPPRPRRCWRELATSARAQPPSRVCQPRRRRRRSGAPRLVANGGADAHLRARSSPSTGRRGRPTMAARQPSARLWPARPTASTTEHHGGMYGVLASEGSRARQPALRGVVVRRAISDGAPLQSRPDRDGSAMSACARCRRAPPPRCLRAVGHPGKLASTATSILPWWLLLRQQRTRGRPRHPLAAA